MLLAGRKPPVKKHSGSSSESDSLIIFARFPRLGQVKTRLEPDLGAQHCLLLYKAMLGDCVERSFLIDCCRYLYLDGCDLTEGRALAHRFQNQKAQGIKVCLQEGADLGERMWNAYTEVSRSSSRVVIVGSDSPSTPLEFIRSAFDVLVDSPLVIGPVDDGGYYLIGLSGPRQEVFQDIQWGTPSVLTETTRKLVCTDYRLLPEWYDIDNRKGLDRLTKDLAVPFEGYPRRTAQYLKENNHLSFDGPFD